MMNEDQQLKEHLSACIQRNDDGLDFRDDDTHYATHAYHRYPATMIPQLPRLFMEAVSKYQNIDRIYDPFMGSGTTLVEASLHGIDSTGVDLNPLAYLIAQVKSKRLEPTKLRRTAQELWQGILDDKKNYEQGRLTVHPLNFPRIKYWFKDYVRIDLQLIKQRIQNIPSRPFRQFFLVVFSTTVRDVSNTRNSEFKMYRMASDKLAHWRPNVLEHFHELMDRNVHLNGQAPVMTGKAMPRLGNAQRVPELPTNSQDLLITSPPYGDSKTTVAYGQFSRTSLQWLNLDVLHADQVTRLDNRLLGGKVQEHELPTTSSPTLNRLLIQIQAKDPKRALQVAQFYVDLFSTLVETKRIMRPDAYQFWVTSNRTVKGIQLPTDQILTELYTDLGIQKITEFHRHISHKRMPSQNSPLNHKGKTAKTMRTEDILLFKTTKHGNSY